MIYKLLRPAEWAAFQAAGTFTGSPKDVEDGFIHFSTAAQAPETARLHFAGVEGLVLAEVDETRLTGVKWESSRGGQSFPHLYGALRLADVARTWTLRLSDGRHVFPDGLGS